MRVWVCMNCGTPVEPVESQGYDDTGGVRCPGSDPGCSPREDRLLLVAEQWRPIEVSTTPTPEQFEELKDALPKLRADYLPD